MRNYIKKKHPKEDSAKVSVVADGRVCVYHLGVPVMYHVVLWVDGETPIQPTPLQYETYSINPAPYFKFPLDLLVYGLKYN
jgi:hypothetical protein